MFYLLVLEFVSLALDVLEGHVDDGHHHVDQDHVHDHGEDEENPSCHLISLKDQSSQIIL